MDKDLVSQTQNITLLHFGEPAYWDLRYQEELRKMVNGNFKIIICQNFVFEVILLGLELFDWYVSFEHGN